MFEIGSGMEVLFRIEKFNYDGVVWDSGWFNNLILNQGLNQLGIHSFNSSSLLLEIGTGKSEPNINRHYLDARYWKKVLGEMCWSTEDPAYKEEWDNTIANFRNENPRMVRELERMLCHRIVSNNLSTSGKIVYAFCPEDFLEHDPNVTTWEEALEVGFTLEDIVNVGPDPTSNDQKLYWQSCNVFEEVFYDYIETFTFFNDSENFINFARKSVDPSLYYEYDTNFVFDIGTFSVHRGIGVLEPTEYLYDYSLPTPWISEIGLHFSDKYTPIFNRQLIRILEGVFDEEISDGNGVAVQFTYSSEFNKLEPETIQIYTYNSSGERLIVVDDGQGNLIGDVDSESTNIVDYNVGDFEFTFNEPPAMNDNISNREKNIKIRYDYWKPTDVAVLGDEGLKIYMKARYYPWMGEAQSYIFEGTLSYTNIVGETDTVGYTASMYDDSNDMGMFEGGEVELFDTEGNSIGTSAMTTSNTVDAEENDGVVVYKSTINFIDTSFSGYVQSVTFNAGNNGPIIKFDLHKSIYKYKSHHLNFFFDHKLFRFVGNSFMSI